MQVMKILDCFKVDKKEIKSFYFAYALFQLLIRHQVWLETPYEEGCRGVAAPLEKIRGSLGDEAAFLLIRILILFACQEL